MNKPTSLVSPRIAFSIFVIALLLSVCYSRAVRRVALGDEFRYIPRESVLMVATGDIESLWHGIDTHLGAALREASDEESALARLKKTMKEEDIQLPRFQDFGRYGLDVHRGLLFSLYRTHQQESEFLLILPVTDNNALLSALADLDDVTPEEIYRHPYKVYGVGSDFVAFPEPGICVFSTSKELLRRSLLFQEENLAHAANNDELFEAVQRLAKGPLMLGPELFVFWQSRTAPFGERSGVLRFEPDQIQFEADIELVGATTKVLESLRKPTIETMDWASRLPPSTMAVALLQDEHLANYETFLTEQVLQKWHSPWKPPVNIPDLTRMLVAVTDYENGLPDFLVGFWGSQDQLKVTAERLQRELRESRDLYLLNEALSAYQRKNRGGSPPTLKELERLRLLAPEEFSLFHRYPLLPDHIGSPEFQASDFSTEDYERKINGHTIRFLTPPLNSNDLLYRQEFRNADKTDLESDRYRMASLLLEDSLWIATDVKDLDGLTRAGNRPVASLRNNPLFRATSAQWAPGSKMQVFFDINRIISAGLLQPGSDLESLVQEYLLTLDDYSVFSAQAVPSADHHRIVIQTNLRRRSLN